MFPSSFFFNQTTHKCEAIYINDIELRVHTLQNSKLYNSFLHLILVNQLGY